MKVFQIGFNKCGTRSLDRWFERSGYKNIHWDKGRLASTIRDNLETGQPLLKGYEDYTFFSDMENIYDERGITYAYEYFRELAEQYPDSKFILNIRPIDKWILSRMNHVNQFTYLEDYMRITGLSEAETVAAWRSHFAGQLQRARDYFQEKPGRLLIFDIEKDSIDKIIQFLPEFNLKPELYEHYAKTKKTSRTSL
jgi:hypothetical protein